VLGVSVDVNGANQAWAKSMGVTYPLLSDGQRAFSRAYQTLYDDPEMVKSNRVGAYLRAKRSWYVIDKQGIVRYIKIDSNQLVPSDELIEVIKKHN